MNNLKGFFNEDNELLFVVSSNSEEDSYWIGEVHLNIPEESNRKNLKVVYSHNANFGGNIYKTTEYILN